MRPFKERGRRALHLVFPAYSDILQSDLLASWVQDLPTPPSTKADNNNNKIEGINNQKLMLFKRGNAISGAPINNGTIQLPNPPIMAGITKKKIIRKAWAVMITLYNW